MKLIRFLRELYDDIFGSFKIDIPLPNEQVFRLIRHYTRGSLIFFHWATEEDFIKLSKKHLGA